MCREQFNVRPNTVYKNTYFDTEQYMDFEYDTERHTLGVIIPCFDVPMPMHMYEEGASESSKIIEVALQLSTKIKQYLHEKERLINQGMYQRPDI